MYFPYQSLRAPKPAPPPLQPRETCGKEWETPNHHHTHRCDLIAGHISPACVCECGKTKRPTQVWSEPN